MYLNSLNHFRAISIVIIVAGHCYGISSLEFNSLFEQIINNLITGGTSLFVFISGFLFHHIFYKKYQYRKFIYAKFKNIIIPYTLLSIVPIFLCVFFKKEIFGDYFLPGGNGAIHEYLIPALKYYWTGRFLTPYWYIPFIFITFLLSPLHIYFIRAKVPTQLFLIVLFSIISILMHRPNDNLSIFQSVVYFFPIYCIGIMTSLNREKVYAFLLGKEAYLFFIVIALAFLEAQLGHVGNYHKSPFSFNGVDILYFQKLFMCFFLLSFLNKFEAYNNNYLHLLASTSFTIFFLHPFLIYAISKVNPDFLQHESWLMYIALVLVIVCVSIAVAVITKKIIPKYSRYFTGY